MILVVSRGTTARARDIQVRRLMISFQYGQVPGGKRSGINGVFALIDPDTPGAEEALAQLRSMSDKFEVVGDVEESTPSVVKPAASPPLPEDNIPPLVKVAFRRGWTLEDLWGTGRDKRWGADGGLSPRTGLSLAEMSQAGPPHDWPAFAPTAYPWEVPGWKQPSLKWAIPGVPPKGQEPQQLVAAVVEQPPLEKLAAPATPAAVPSNEQPSEPEDVEVDAPPPEPEDGEDGDAMIRAAIKDADADTRAALDNYGTEDQVIAAIIIAMGLDASSSKPVSASKLSYHLSKEANGLPRSQKSHHQAIFSILSALE